MGETKAIEQIEVEAEDTAERLMVTVRTPIGAVRTTEGHMGILPIRLYSIDGLGGVDELPHGRFKLAIGTRTFRRV